MEFRILGPLEVVDDGRTVELGGTRQQALLAILLLQRGQLRSVARLIEDLYGAEPPPTATKSMQAHISRLRKALASTDRVVSRARGYALRLGPDELDADRFEAIHQTGRKALAGGRPGDAVASFDEALALCAAPRWATSDPKSLRRARWHGSRSCASAASRTASMHISLSVATRP